MNDVFFNRHAQTRAFRNELRYRTMCSCLHFVHDPQSIMFALFATACSIRLRALHKHLLLLLRGPTIVLNRLLTHATRPEIDEYWSVDWNALHHCECEPVYKNANRWWRESVLNRMSLCLTASWVTQHSDCMDGMQGRGIGELKSANITLPSSRYETPIFSGSVG